MVVKTGDTITIAKPLQNIDRYAIYTIKFCCCQANLQHIRLFQRTGIYLSW